MRRVLLAGGSVFDARSGEVAQADVVLARSRIVAVGRGLDADEAVDRAGALLRRGVTTIRDAWGADTGVRLAVERGWVEGPEILVSPSHQAHRRHTARR